MNSKKCICCGNEKPIELFHFHKGMADGRLNKCKTCSGEYFRQRRLAMGEDKLRAERRKEYEKALENGKRVRVKSLEQLRLDSDPIGRKLRSLRHFHKKRSKAFVQTEFDELVFDEAVRLCALRNQTVGGQWWVDHVVPINGKGVCGLHTAFNMQVVPRKWNEKKSNIRVGYFFPIYGI